VANQPPSPKRMSVEEHEDGLLFGLRDGVFVLVKWSSPTQFEVSAWRDDRLLPPDIGNLNKASFRARLVQSMQDAFGAENVPKVREDVEDVTLALSARESGGKSLGEKLEGRAGPSVAERLVMYARKGAKFFHTPDSKGYASAKVGGHSETYRIRSHRFRLWLQHRFWCEERRRLEDARAVDGGAPYEGSPGVELPEAVRDQALGDAISQLEALALFEGPEREVHLRVAAHEGAVLVDLGDEAWRAVRIEAGGWEIVDEPPVAFVRPAGMGPLPEPTRGGSVDGLRSLLNISRDADGERNWRLILSWLAYAFVPDGQYPLLVVIGPQGAAKSTAVQVLRSVIDPNVVPLRTAPRDEHNLYIDAESNWLLTFDNLSSMPPWLSDALCRLATGGGFSTRTLYSDRDQELFKATRPVAMNGISDIASRPDLLDRAVMVNLPAIAEEDRKLKKVINAELARIAPGVLGFLFDAVAAGLAKAAGVDERRLPRMADYATWGIATEEALGGESGSFMQAYAGSREDATQTALAASPVAPYLYKLAESHEGLEAAWQGTPTQLWVALGDAAPEDLRRTKEWPGSPAALTQVINRLAPSLSEIGVRVERPTQSRKGGRVLRVYFQQPDPGDGEDDDGGGGDDGENVGVPQETPIGRPDSGLGDEGDAGDDDIPEGSGDKEWDVEL
jgi:hypothetical protein